MIIRLVGVFCLLSAGFSTVCVLIILFVSSQLCLSLISDKMGRNKKVKKVVPQPKNNTGHDVMKKPMKNEGSMEAVPGSSGVVVSSPSSITGKDVFTQLASKVTLNAEDFKLQTVWNGLS